MEKACKERYDQQYSINMMLFRWVDRKNRGKGVMEPAVIIITLVTLSRLLLDYLILSDLEKPVVGKCH